MGMTVSQVVEFARAMAFKRKVENQAPPQCPSCHEDRQIQLRNLFDTGGVLYRCRMCRHYFHGSDIFVPAEVYIPTQTTDNMEITLEKILKWAGQK